MKPSDKVLRKAEEHFKQCYPQEGAGIVANGRFYPCKNIHSDPENFVEIDDAVLVKKSATHFLHSHPVIPNKVEKFPRNWFSGTDIQGHIDSGLVWGVVATDGTNCTDWNWLDDEDRPPLLERHYVHGVTDCFSAVRDWYKLEQGIDIPNFPREMEWWANESAEGYYNPFDRYFADSGFEEIPFHDLKPGDGLLFAVNGKTFHCGVYVGDNQFFHHQYSARGVALSKVDSFRGWQRVLAKVVRFKEKGDGSN